MLEDFPRPPFGPIKLLLRLLLLSACVQPRTPNVELSDQERKYIVVIDAGSTGSRVHVYPYVPATPLPDFLPHEEFTIKEKPGLSSFEKEPDKAGDSLNNIIAKAKENIPSTTPISEVPIFLVATAGLRRVEAKNPAATQAILASVRKKLGSTGFKFRDEWASIITGIDEGVFGWVTVNYLLDNFAAESTKTTGVFEMGGESVQLTYLPSSIQKGKEVAKKLLIPVTIAGRTYNVFTYSWMGYGMEAAQAKFDEQVNDETANPCYLSGDTRTSEGENPVTFTGHGNFEACYLLLKENLKLAKGTCAADSHFQCALDGLKIPTITPEDEFYLIENFWYTSNVAGFQPEQMKGQKYFDRMMEFGGEYCAKPFADAKEFLGTLTDYEPHEDEIKKECFCTAYIDAMLKEGVTFSNSNNFQVVREIDEADLDWALGYAIVQEATGIARGNAPLGYWVYALLLAVALGIGYYFYRRKQQRGFPRYASIDEENQFMPESSVNEL